ncbi:hypothetical protein Q9R32_10860 [Actinotalea sp. AC32]|nr:hypothetical protein [Actinotalea sp. AC32]
MRARTALATLLLLPVVLAPGVAHAAPFPDTIALPDGFAPEGIESGRGAEFFVGSLQGGAVYRGDLRTGDGDVLVPATGTVAVGIAYEVARDRLWVAGGPTGELRVYDAASGDLLETYAFEAGFLNDVAIADGVVYATDSALPQLAVVPLDEDGSLPDPSAATTLPLTGDLVYTEGFNANGIVAAEGGRWLVVVQSSTASLFRVDPATGETVLVDLGGEAVPNGDGLELRGRTLFVVQNMIEQVSVVQLSGGLTSGTVRTVLTDPDLDVPTTATFALGRLWAVNARFGTAPTPTTSYDVVQLGVPLR